MNRNKHIGILYSYGPHFLRTVREVRQQEPDARITVYIPEGFPLEMLQDLNVETLSLTQGAGTKPTLASAFMLLRALRRVRLDQFVVLFDSPRLQMLAALSQAAERWCYQLDGSKTPVRPTFMGSFLQTVRRGMVGRIRYVKIWLHVYGTRVDTKAINALDEPRGDSRQ